MNNTKPNAPILTLPVLVGGGLVLAAALLTRLTVGSPLAVIHKLGASVLLPPLWLTGLLWLGSYVLMGAAVGYLLSCPPGNARREADLWRGCTFLVLAVVFSLVWYTLLFGKLCLLLSCLCLLLAAVCALVCMISWWSVGKGAAVISLGFSLWQICLLFLQFAVILHT